MNAGDDGLIMQWFGTYWGAAICNEAPQVAVPVGRTCGHCAEPIAAADRGIVMPSMGAPVTVVFHAECQLRIVVGGINHQRGRCMCCGGDRPPDPPDVSVRQAARLAALYYLTHTEEIPILP